MKARIGIDFGGMYVRVSVVGEDGTPYILPSAEGEEKIPALVFFSEDGQVSVGAAAVEKGLKDSSRLATSVKSAIDYGDFSYCMDCGEYSPEDVISMILQKAVGDAEAALGDTEIEGAVIACPLVFNSLLIGVLIRAAERVILKNGERLRVLRSVYDPIAALLSCAEHFGEERERRILVYDLGGNSFDICVVDFDPRDSKRPAKVVTANGDRSLGGRDWDQVIVNYAINTFAERTGIDEGEIWCDFEALDRLRADAEAVKLRLSREASASLQISCGGVTETVELTRELLERESELLLVRCAFLTEQMLSEAGIAAEELDGVLAVGGATLLPQVERYLRSTYANPILPEDREAAIAKGAALLAHGLE